MDSHVTLAEAASYLGVSKATLRNWDRSGKLRAVRHPINNYRVYAVGDLREVQSQLVLLLSDGDVASTNAGIDVRGAKKLIGRLHNILRDEDGNSNIIERFDELTKLLFLKIYTDQYAEGQQLIARAGNETENRYVKRIRNLYITIAGEQASIIPRSFSEIRASDAAVLEAATALSLVSFDGVAFDVKGLAYEEVIGRTFDKGDHQQFFTPPPIVRFMVSVLGDRIRGAVCDPASGTGGFLVEVAKSQCSYDSLTAFEIDERLAWVTGINLFTHGAHSVTSHFIPGGGTLGRAAEQFLNQFDTIITNPPFGSDFSEPNALSGYELGRDRQGRRRGILFLERCYHLLKSRGTLAIILDEGVLSHSSSEDVRSFILDRFNVLGIVGLPETAFMPYANVNASILLLEKGKGRTGSRETFFAKPENVGRKANGDDDYIYTETGAPQLNSDFPLLLELYRSRQKGDSIDALDIAYTADIRGNLKDDRNGRRLDFRYHHPAKHRSREQLARAGERLKLLSEICIERNLTVIPSTELQDQTILYTGLAHIESGTGIARQVPTPTNSLKSAVKRYEPRDIVFAKMRPNLRKVAFMDFAEGGYVSPECVVLTVDCTSAGIPLIDPLLLTVLLRSDLVYGQIMHLIAGIGRPRLSGSDLRRVLIPTASEANQEQWRAHFDGELRASHTLRARAAALLQEAADMERRAAENLATAFVLGFHS
jgi:type I restriction enzyme M protein